MKNKRQIGDITFNSFPDPTDPIRKYAGWICTRAYDDMATTLANAEAIWTPFGIIDNS